MTYFVFDCEFDRDLDGHAIYQATERYDPDGIERVRESDPRCEPRWAFRQLVCVSWVVVSQDHEGIWRAGPIQSFGMPEQDERAALSAFITAVRRLPAGGQVVSWGGSSYDEPILRMCALRAGLALPEALWVPLLPGKRHGHAHLDLMVHMAGDAARVHLSELCAALRIPAKVCAEPGAVAGFIDRGRWSEVKAVCENDVFSTAALLIMLLCAREGGSRTFGSLLSLATQAAERTYRPYAGAFADWSRRLVAEAIATEEAKLRALTAIG